MVGRAGTRPRADQLVIQLIKKLSATPTLHAQNESVDVEGATDPQMALQANKATFFFRLVCGRAEDAAGACSPVSERERNVLIGGKERELDKVNEFYLQKEAEVCRGRGHMWCRC